MTILGLADVATDATPLVVLAPGDVDAWLAKRPEAERAFVKAWGFAGEAGRILPVADASGRVAAVLIGLGAPVVSPYERDLWSLGALPDTLPLGTYKLATEPDEKQATAMATGWALGAYAFERYKKRKRAPATLLWPAKADRARVTREVEAITLARDLINTPAGDLGPAAMAQAALDLAGRHGLKASVIVGDDLLAQNYPAIHTVGRAAAEPPRLVDIRYGTSGPRVSLVGKSVVFDTGGLDLKSAAGMKLMKKDMGGGANVLALTHMIVSAKLPIRLRVLLPIVENAVSAPAFHPLDVIRMRNGKTVEVGNTDAEGRLIMADALVEADSEKPDLLVNMSTLTGNARAALGPELPAVFMHQDDLAAALAQQALERADPCWRLPLWPHYRKQIDSRVADLSSTGTSEFNGAITAAHFLSEFVTPTTRWIHVDHSAWNFTLRPGRPEGGETQVVRALFGLIEAMV